MIQMLFVLKLINMQINNSQGLEDLIKKKAQSISSQIVMGKGKTEFFINLIKKNLNTPCLYCGSFLMLDNLSLDHIVPFGDSKARKNKLIRKQFDTEANLHIICKKCNLLKGDLDSDRFMKLMNFLNSDFIIRQYVTGIMSRGNLTWRR